MFKAAVLSVLGCLAGMASSVAHAQYYFSPVSYSVSPVIRPVYSAPIPVGVSYYAPAPVVVARPVYAPVVRTVYAAPVTTYVAPTISYASYEPTPIAIDPVVVAAEPVYYAPAPVMVTPAPVIVSTPAVVRESLVVRPYSSVYRSSTYGWGSGVHVYERSTPFRTVTRVRGW